MKEKAESIIQMFYDTISTISQNPKGLDMAKAKDCAILYCRGIQKEYEYTNDRNVLNFSDHDVKRYDHWQGVIREIEKL